MSRPRDRAAASPTRAEPTPVSASVPVETSAASATPGAAPARPVAAQGGDAVVSVRSVSKCYLIYERPQHRLWQGLFRGRRRFYRDFWAVRDVSFEVRPGETVGIIGRNGSGKSTLLQMVCGTLATTSGQVSVTGRLAALLELGSGFNPEFTGRENVYLNGTILGLTRVEIDQRFDAIAAFADIGAFIEQPVKTYSSGMVVRLAFAVIAHVDADLLVIDEALAVGDALFTQKCLRFLRRFQQHGAVLFVSHDTGAVLNLCQRALWMDEGVCVKAGPAKAVVEAYQRANIERAQLADLVLPLPGAVVPAVDQPDESVQTGGSSPSADGQSGTDLKDGFDPSRPSFGAGGAIVRSVELVGEAGEATVTFRGGEKVLLRVVVEAASDIGSAIVGFHVKDRLGQLLFGANTCEATSASPVALAPRQQAVATFAFTMPCLLTGKYTLDIAVAEGTLFQHVQHQWFHDATVIHVLTDTLVTGVFAVDTTTALSARARP